MKAHITKCPNKDTDETSLAEPPRALQNEYAKYLIKSYQRNVKAS